MSGYAFKTELFSLETAEQRMADSDGHGMEFAQWLQPQLEQRGYKVHAVKLDTCGWRMMLQLEPFELYVACFVTEAGDASNFDMLNMDKQDAVWQCYARASKPLFKSLFKKMDDAPAETKLDEELKAILSGEPLIHFVAEPEFDHSGGE